MLAPSLVRGVGQIHNSKPTTSLPERGIPMLCGLSVRPSVCNVGKIVITYIEIVGK